MSHRGLLGLLFLSCYTLAADVQVIAYGPKAPINLKGITPLSPQLRAILAYTAMRMVSINRNDKLGIYTNRWKQYYEYRIHADRVEVLKRVGTIIE